MHKNFEIQIGALIDIYLTINFKGLFELSKQFIKNESDPESSSIMEDPMAPENLKAVKPSDLEAIGKDFLKSYKQKTEGIIKDIRHSISQNLTN